MNLYFNHYNFNELIEISDIEGAWAYFKDIICTAVSQYVPKIYPRRYPQPKWFDSEIQHHLNKVHTLRRRYRSKPSPNLLSQLSLAEAKLSDEMSIAKQDFESQLIRDLVVNNSSKIYKYISSLSSSHQLPPIMHFDDKQASSSFDQVQLLNQFFHSVFTHSSHELPSSISLPVSSKTLSNINISTADVFQALHSLDPNKASGIDLINPSLLKYCAESLTAPIHHLLTLSLRSQVLPQEWHTHRIVPVFKSSDRTSVTNYRPIFLLCIISKILEKIIYQKLFDFLHNQLSVHQFGFIPQRSCLQQLLLFTHELYLAKSTHCDTDAIYLDYKKAFDSVVHVKLLHKLWAHGISGELWSWIKAYLTNRTQCVSINGQTSTFLPVVSGVPKGSLLGPLFYIIYINDMFDTIKVASWRFTYADDTKLLMVLHDSFDNVSLQDDINHICVWSNQWDLLLNPTKSYHIHFHFSKSTPDQQYFICNNPVSTDQNIKDLGILFTSSLQWDLHYKSIISKAYKMFYVLRRTFTTPSQIARKRLYFTLVWSHLVYCSPLWRPHLIRDIKNFERVQCRATKFILNNYHLDYKSRLLQCQILPLMCFLELNDILFLVKSLKSPNPAFNIHKYVTFNTSATRSGTFNKLIHNFTSTSYSHQFYFNRIVRLWNSLPYIDLSFSVSTIKSSLQNFLWNHFVAHLDSDNVHTHFTTFVHVTAAHIFHIAYPSCKVVK